MRELTRATLFGGCMATLEAAHAVWHGEFFTGPIRIAFNFCGFAAASLITNNNPGKLAGIAGAWNFITLEGLYNSTYYAAQAAMVAAAVNEVTNEHFGDNSKSSEGSLEHETLKPKMN